MDPLVLIVLKVIPGFYYLFLAVRIETKHVLSVRRLEFSRTCCNINIRSRRQDKTGLVIRFVKKEENSVWSIQTLNALCSAADVDQYYNEIKLYLELSSKSRFQYFMTLILVLFSHLIRSLWSLIVCFT